MPDLPDFDLSKRRAVTPPPVIGEVKNLNELDLDSELASHYSRAIRMVEALEYDDSIPANQKAQAMNTLTAILQQIIKIRTELYNAEYLKRLENALLKTLKVLPTAAQEEFMEEYERAVRTAS